MPDLDLDSIVKDMGNAALPHLKGGAAKAKQFGKTEALKIAQTAQMLAQGVTTGRIDANEAKLILEVQKNASRSILLTIKGLGIVAVENAVNAAMDVVRKAIKTATGVVL
jgi:hypothetical protein